MLILPINYTINIGFFLHIPQFEAFKMFTIYGFPLNNIKKSIKKVKSVESEPVKENDIKIYGQDNALYYGKSCSSSDVKNNIRSNHVDKLAVLLKRQPHFFCVNEEIHTIPKSISISSALQIIGEVDRRMRKYGSIFQLSRSDENVMISESETESNCVSDDDNSEFEKSNKRRKYNGSKNNNNNESIEMSFKINGKTFEF